MGRVAYMLLKICIIAETFLGNIGLNFQREILVKKILRKCYRRSHCIVLCFQPQENNFVHLVLK